MSLNELFMRPCCMDGAGHPWPADDHVSHNGKYANKPPDLRLFQECGLGFLLMHLFTTLSCMSSQPYGKACVIHVSMYVHVCVSVWHMYVHSATYHIPSSEYYKTNTHFAHVSRRKLTILFSQSIKISLYWSREDTEFVQGACTVQTLTKPFTCLLWFQDVTPDKGYCFALSDLVKCFWSLVWLIVPEKGREHVQRDCGVCSSSFLHVCWVVVCALHMFGGSCDVEWVLFIGSVCGLRVPTHLIGLFN